MPKPVPEPGPMEEDPWKSSVMTTGKKTTGKKKQGKNVEEEPKVEEHLPPLPDFEPVLKPEPKSEPPVLELISGEHTKNWLREKMEKDATGPRHRQRKASSGQRR